MQAITTSMEFKRGRPVAVKNNFVGCVKILFLKNDKTQIKITLI